MPAPGQRLEDPDLAPVQYLVSNEQDSDAYSLLRVSDSNLYGKKSRPSVFNELIRTVIRVLDLLSIGDLYLYLLSSQVYITRLSHVSFFVSPAAIESLVEKKEETKKNKLKQSQRLTHRTPAQFFGFSPDTAFAPIQIKSRTPCAMYAPTLTYSASQPRS